MHAASQVGTAAEGGHVGPMRKGWASALVATGVAMTTLVARADVAPSPPEACASRALGDRCFDALGRPGRCVAAPFSGGRCSLTVDSAAPLASSSASPAPSSSPASEPPSPSDGSSGCSAPFDSPGAGAWIVLLGVLFAARELRRRSAPA